MSLQIFRGKKIKMPILKNGEFGFCTDTNQLYIGNSGINVLVGDNGNKKYRVHIDPNNPNPLTAVTYGLNAENMEHAQNANEVFNANDWKDNPIYNSIRPCLLKNGVVQGYLNKNDFTKWEDNHTPLPDITSGGSGDVMIEFNKFYYKVENNQFTVSETKNTNYSNFPFLYKDVEKSKFYIGAYHGWKDGSGKLRSLSGKTPTRFDTQSIPLSQAIETVRASAWLNGEGYENISFNKLVGLQVLYLLFFKNLDCKTALGKDLTDESFGITTGSTDTKGFNFGSQIGKSAKLLGVENPWGGNDVILDGLEQTLDMLQCSTGGFADKSTYKHNICPTAIIKAGFLRTTRITTNPFDTSDINLFFQNDVDGTATTYYCTPTQSTSLHCVGGNLRSNGNQSLFNLNNAPTQAVSARLMYCGE